MDKIKITEIKSNIKIKEIKKVASSEESDLEKELDSDSFPKDSSLESADSSFVPLIKQSEIVSESSDVSFVPLIKQSEIVSQSEGEELVRQNRTEDAPLFSESARYDAAISRTNTSESRARYESSQRATERTDPSIVRSSSISSQSQVIGFRNDELDRINGVERNYSSNESVVKDNKIKSLRPWEV